MIHAYHVIWGTYGFWLPNDPRGSWSDFVASWELLRFGKASRSVERRDIQRDQWETWRAAAQQALKFPRVTFTGLQARAAATGFADGVRKSQLSIWACSILPEHVHMVVARHRFSVEKICNLLKGEATKRLLADSLHPQARFRRGERPPSPWARGQWKVFLEDESAIEEAIHYVEENPVKEGKPRQKWSFVTPFAGLPEGGWVTYH
jgi:REP element-mobilizing transposase RayT